MNNCTITGTAVACAVGFASWAWAPALTQILLPGACFALGVLACLVWQSIWLPPTDAELERRTGEPHIDGYPLQSGLPPTDAELERRTGEPHVDGWPLQSGLPPPAKGKK